MKSHVSANQKNKIKQLNFDIAEDIASKFKKQLTKEKGFYSKCLKLS